MVTEIRTKIDEIVEEMRIELYQKASHWGKARTPSEFFDFEQELQITLNMLQTKVVGAVLEEIHRDRIFVVECQKQALQQRSVHSDGWREVPIRTLGGEQIRIRTVRSKPPKEVNQEHTEKKQRQEGTGIYPVLRRLGIVRLTTPRLLAECNRQIADGPSGAEAEERLANREIMRTQIPMWFHVRDFASLALWQRQVAASNLEQVQTIEPAPLAGKRVVVGLDGGRLRIRINKKTYSHELRPRNWTLKREMLVH